jgi:hypothetical protein
VIGGGCLDVRFNEVFKLCPTQIVYMYHVCVIYICVYM